MSDNHNPRPGPGASKPARLDSEQLERMMNIPDFTPAQLAMIKAASAPYEKGYKPTSSLIEGV